jgi:hypothetical protein
MGTGPDAVSSPVRSGHVERFYISAGDRGHEVAARTATKDLRGVEPLSDGGAGWPRRRRSLSAPSPAMAGRTGH